MIKKILKAVWQFCSYLFVPQRGEAQEGRRDYRLRNNGSDRITSSYILYA
jgi:hypothetical protein